MCLRSFFRVLALSLASASTEAQVANGSLQIHHMDIGQGDAAVLISPKGTVVLFDSGRDMAHQKDCSSEIGYLDQLGVKQIDYLFVSHYHYDHIDCIPEVLQHFPLKGPSIDRGTDQSVPTTVTYRNYKKAVAGHEQTGTVDEIITLDADTNPVTLKVVSLSGHYSGGGTVDTVDENDLSLSVVVSFGGFREEIGGDLSGEQTSMYQDVETPVVKDVGGIDVYKVHHHCSSHSSNAAWMKATQPTIAVISTGNDNTYFHPDPTCLERLHDAGVTEVLWTEEGAGGKPGAGDVIAGDVTIEVPPNATKYSVSYGGTTESFNVKQPQGASSGGGVAPPPVVAPPDKFAWSILADHYYDIGCPTVNRIMKKNLKTGPTPPDGKVHRDCPTDVTP
jgi:beta-lactamase superfamily II metal-dependent hydrolase